MAHLNEIEGKDQQAQAVSALGIYYRGLIVFGGRHAPEGLKLPGSSRGVRPLLKSGDSNRAHTIRPGCGQPPLLQVMPGGEWRREKSLEGKKGFHRTSMQQLPTLPSTIHQWRRKCPSSLWDLWMPPSTTCTHLCQSGKGDLGYTEHCSVSELWPLFVHFQRCLCCTVFPRFPMTLLPGESCKLTQAISTQMQKCPPDTEFYVSLTDSTLENGGQADHGFSGPKKCVGKAQLQYVSKWWFRKEKKLTFS